MEAKVVLWPRETSQGEYLLKIRISDANKSVYRLTGISIKKDRWNAKKQELVAIQPPKKTDGELKKQRYDEYLSLRKTLNEKEKIYTDKIKSLANEGRSVTIDQFIQMVENPVKQMTVHSYFNLLVDRFKLAQSIGQSTVYKSTHDSLKKFHKSDIKFHDIDLSFLKRYEEFLRKAGLKDTTISLYFRTLRSVYNMAIGEHFARQSEYPFGKRTDNTTFTVSKFDDQTRKRAITEEELQSIVNAMLEPAQDFAREIFLFSYYAAGINFGDMAKLTWRDFDGTRINYTRTKTHVKISTFLLPYCKNIIHRQRLRTGIDQDNYIFEILNQHIHKTHQQIQNRIHKVLGQVNQTLKEIAKTAQIKDIISTYTARHSFITHAANSEKVTPFDLQTMVGHKDISTTMIYFKDSDQGKKDLLMQKIIGL